MNYKSNLALKPEYNNDPFNRRSDVKTSIGAGGAAGLTLVVNNASAAIPAGVTTAITEAAADVAVIGAAVIIVFVAIKAWKWIRGAL